ncbi:unnamed protein product [Sphagnum jensenii]|uniref:LNS2/PITP domain-containing protein n=1 Tax=Sphagnum jensenii TaxID=128206 RepID=A0ABP0W878_9BRYO
MILDTSDSSVTTVMEDRDFWRSLSALRKLSMRRSSSSNEMRIREGGGAAAGHAVASGSPSTTPRNVTPLTPLTPLRWKSASTREDAELVIEPREIKTREVDQQLSRLGTKLDAGDGDDHGVVEPHDVHQLVIQLGYEEVYRKPAAKLQPSEMQQPMTSGLGTSTTQPKPIDDISLNKEQLGTQQIGSSGDSSGGHERNPSSSPGDDAMTMTIEFLRARLLSERAASKAAKHEADQLSKKVLELEHELEEIVEQRQKAEKDAEKAISNLRNAGHEGINGTTTLVDEVDTQTSSKPQEVGFQSSGSVDGQNSGIREANKMLTIENDAQKSKDEESELNSIDQSLMVAERSKGNLSEQNTENGGSEDEKKEDKKEEENRDGLAIEVVSSIAIQNSPGKEAENLENAKSSLDRAETISDLLENSWECGSGLKNGQSQPTIESQTPIASSSLYSQHEAAVQDSYSRSSHSQRSEKVETMRREEELAVNEGNIMPANKDSTLSSSLCLQGGETSNTEAADDFSIPRHSEANCSDADFAETREKYEVVSTQNGENRSEVDLENPLPYSGTGAVIKKVSHFESNTSQEEEEECHGKVAVGEIDYGTSISHGENGSEDELYNLLSYGDIGSASRKSIYFEANSSEEEEEEEEEEEILGKVVDGDEDLDIFRRKSDPIGVPVTLENSALDDMFLIAKDHPFSESLPDVRFQSADATISAIRSALSRSVGSEPLPRTQRSADRKDSFLGNPVRSPAEGTHEDFKQNLVEKCVGSPLGSGRSEAESAVQSNVLVKGSLPAGVEVSLCRHLLKEHMGSEEAAEAFASVKVSLHEFKSNAASIIANDKLVIRVGGQYYPWSVAAPVVLGILTFGQVIMPATNGAIPMECPEPVPKSQAAVGTIVPAARGGWNLWPFPLRRPKTPEQSIVPNPLVSRDTLLVAAGTAVHSPFVNDLMLQNAYYERPRRSKVRTIIPTSQMLAQMNLKEGNNRITFTFFTRMLGNQQVDARVYLWKWNTRIVISDVDGTITKSDVLGQVMPLVGKDWTQSGVARLFSAIKENGYELLFLSARAISQADLTRQFLFNVKQDGETLPDGPVVISPDGLFPSLYREVIRRTPHEFKIGCLQDIRSLFPEGCNPFYAGFGNRDTDEISYLKVGIPKGKIFIINPKGEVAVNSRVHVKTYTSLHKLVNDMFPAQTYMEQEDYNSWNFWKLPLPDIEDDLKSVSASSSKRS